MNQVNIFKDEHDLVRAMLDRIVDLMSREEDGKSAYYMAISGGNTPRKLFCHMADNYSRIPCPDKLQLFWVDERCVPPDHEQSNYRMCNESLISRIPISGNQVHRMKGEVEPALEADRYGRLLNSMLPIANSRPVFDLILLGMGTDGHTASIFPGHIELFESPDSCEVAVHPQTDQNRITLTGSILNNARHLIFMVAGNDKASMLRNVLREEGGSEFPASHVNPVHGILEWYVDEAAAELL